MLIKVPVIEGPVVDIGDGIAIVVREPLEFVLTEETVIVEREPVAKLRIVVVRIRPSGFRIVDNIVTLATGGAVGGSTGTEVVFVLPSFVPG